MSHQLDKIIDNVSIDCVIFGFETSQLKVLLIKRAIDPFRGSMALPGGFILKAEEIETAAQRILFETTGINNLYMEEFAVFGGVNRFPERRVFTISFYALVRPEDYTLHCGIDTSEIAWVPYNTLPELPFDHNQIVEKAINKLKQHVRMKPIGFELLPRKFTLPQLQNLYETVLEREIDKRNFRKKLMKMDLVTKLDEKDTNNQRRAAYLYTFERKNYKKFLKQGFTFDL